MSTTTRNDRTLRRVYGAVTGVGFVVASLATVFFGVRWGVSVLVGAAIALGNLWILARTIRNLFGGERGAAVPWSMVAVLKFFALLGFTYLAVKGGVEPLGLAFGFGALPLGIVLGSLIQAPDANRMNEGTDHA